MTARENANPLGSVDVQSTLTVTEFENLLDAVAIWNESRAEEANEIDRGEPPICLPARPSGKKAASLVLCPSKW